MIESWISSTSWIGLRRFWDGSCAERRRRQNEFGWVCLLSSGCVAVCSYFAHFIASMLVFQNARSLRSLTCPFARESTNWASPSLHFSNATIDAAIVTQSCGVRLIFCFFRLSRSSKEPPSCLSLMSLSSQPVSMLFSTKSCAERSEAQF